MFVAYIMAILGIMMLVALGVVVVDACTYRPEEEVELMALIRELDWEDKKRMLKEK